MSESIVERITDILVSDGCGDSDQCEKTARRVLSALREPTQAMADAGWEHIPHRYCSGEDVGNAWQAMIDAALADTPIIEPGVGQDGADGSAAASDRPEAPQPPTAR